MKIAVLVKQVPDTWEERRLDPATGLLDRGASESVADEINERALEVALRHKDGHKKTESVADEINERALEVALRHKDGHKKTEIVAVTMGPASAAQALRKALSMGADSAVHVLDDALAGADMGRTAAVLAAALRKTGSDLVIAGNESTDGRGGLVPAMLAEHLGLPLLTALDTVEITDTDVSGEAGLDSGILAVRAPLPALVTVTERAAETRFPNFKGIMTAKRKPVETWSLADLGAELPDARSVVAAVSERPARAAGKKIFDDGTAAEELVAFLAAGRLI